MKRPAVYIVANMINGTLYTGVTSDLPRRIWEHRNGVGDGFASRFGCRILVWFEMHDTMESAILEEKRIKAGSRGAKLRRIEASNPDSLDLFDSIAQG